MPNAYRMGRQSSGAAVTSNVITLIPADANTTGVVLRTGRLYATGGSVTLFADKVAPASIGAGQRTVFSVSATAAGASQTLALPFPIYIDPGFGVHIAGANTNGGGDVSWDLVDGLENA